MKKWNQPELMDLSLCNTKSPSGNKTCRYQGNVTNCPAYQKGTKDALPMNQCMYSWGNDCSLTWEEDGQLPDFGVNHS